MRVNVDSEIGPLQTVVVGRPQDEFDCMVPANLAPERILDDGTRVPNPDYLMFDDLVLLGRMKAEHGKLVHVLAAACGNRGVHTVRGLVAASLGDDTARRETISAVLELERTLYGTPDDALGRAEALMLSLNAMRLTDLLFTGRERYERQQVLRWPIPNALFARDLGAAMGDALVLTHAARAGRRRDMLLMRVVARHHPLLADVDRIDVADDGPIRDPDGAPIATIEGGDLQVLSPTVALVGCGIRTTDEAARRLAARLLGRGFEVVLRVDLPLRRGAMHLDTVFTQVSRTECLVFPPILSDPAGQGLAITAMTARGERPIDVDLLTALRDVGVELDPIPCGGDDPIAQQREQWSDGANAFALAPGVIVTYARNVQTLRQLGMRGFKTVSCDEFCLNATYYLSGGHKIAVAIDGTELVRGRGGPRCLTLPLLRASVF